MSQLVVMLLAYKVPRSQGPFSSSLEKVPWLLLVMCLCMPTKAALRADPQLNFVNSTIQFCLGREKPYLF